MSAGMHAGTMSMGATTNAGNVCSRCKAWHDGTICGVVTANKAGTASVEAVGNAETDSPVAWASNAGTVSTGSPISAGTLSASQRLPSVDIMRTVGSASVGTAKNPRIASSASNAGDGGTGTVSSNIAGHAGTASSATAGKAGTLRPHPVSGHADGNGFLSSFTRVATSGHTLCSRALPASCCVPDDNGTTASGRGLSPGITDVSDVARQAPQPS